MVQNEVCKPDLDSDLYLKYHHFSNSSFSTLTDTKCSVESTLNLENIQFLMEILSSVKFLGHPLSLDRVMSGNGSCWSQFYNG